MIRPGISSILLLTAALAAGAAEAGARITVRTDLPATVIVDGKDVGKTPLTVNMLYSGDRRVEVRNKGTGLSYVYKVYSPEKGTASRIIDSSFQGAAPVSQSIVNQVTLAAPPEPVVKPSDQRRVREKVRIRNTVLGAGLVNALFNHGPHRHGIFVGLFWLGLINELLHAR